MSDQPIPTTNALPILSAAEVEDVFTATEEVRAAEFPNVPTLLLEDILAAERDNADNRGAAARAVARTVDNYLVNTKPPPSVSESRTEGP